MTSPKEGTIVFPRVVGRQSCGHEKASRSFPARNSVRGVFLHICYNKPFHMVGFLNINETFHWPFGGKMCQNLLVYLNWHQPGPIERGLSTYPADWIGMRVQWWLSLLIFWKRGESSFFGLSKRSCPFRRGIIIRRLYLYRSLGNGQTEQVWGLDFLKAIHFVLAGLWERNKPPCICIAL